MTETTPHTFDVQAWLTDSALPQASATVYKRADVIGRLTELKRRIELEAGVDASGERTAGEKSPTAMLEAEYEHLLTVFGGSALTVYVRALTRDELKALRAAHQAQVDRGEITELQSNETFGYDLLSKAIVSVEEANKDRVDVTFTPAQVKALEEALGSVQLTAVLEARLRAQAAMPEVDADFLHKRSGSDKHQG